MKRTLLALLVVAGAAWGQQQPLPQAQYDDGDAPDHGVARISVATGDVSVRHGDQGDIGAAAVNGPLVMDDQLMTGNGGRAEIQFDSANMMRLAPGTEVRMGELQDRRYLPQVAIGTTMFRVLRDSSANVEISTPTVSVRPTGQSAIRVTVRQDGFTEITVRLGQAEIFSPRGSEMLQAGQTMQARGTATDPEFQIVAAIARDDFDQFNEQRDQSLERAQVSSRYTNPDIYGTEDLDANGRWVNDSQYGNVWVPTVAAGWAPYREGRWVDEPYYGWSWVSYDPWGWAPYHYGRWYESSYGWAWYPGPRVGRYYWHPAYVGFFGWGSGLSVGVGFGFGNVGWVPLAPYERFHPWYGGGRSFNSVAIVNNTNIVNTYRNARGLNGITSVRANDFGRGTINRNNFVRANNADLVRAGSVQGAMPFGASRESRMQSDRPVNTASMPRVNENTRFYSRGSGNRNADNRGNGGGGVQNGGFGGTGARQSGASNNGDNRPINNGSNRGQENRPENNNSANQRGFSNAAPNNNSGNGNSGWRRLDQNAPQAAPQNTRQNNVQNNARSEAPQVRQTPNIDSRSNGNGNGNGNGNSWRRFDPAQQGNGNRAPVNQAPVNQVPQYRNERGNSAPQAQPQAQSQSRPYEARQQQPVRISPQITQPRSAPPQVSRPEPQRAAPAPAPRVEAPRGNFGNARPAPSGGGGGNHSGGGGGGNHGGGGGGGNHHR